MRGKQREIRRTDGFTLIEVMVVMIILAVLAAIAIPAFSAWLPRYRLKRAATDLHSNMQLARLSAVKANASRDVAFSAGQYVISGVNKTVILSGYGSGVKFDGPSGETYSISPVTFSSRGMSSGNAYVYLSNDTHSGYYRVGVLTSGVMKLERWNGSGWE
ncbi:MAG: prepilin-type N-terminal cleavage/methylation domain-containing protein [Deltaproteobacteria bacterium]|nr:prepilin-type N-terminal cleavage/methylation domain-containing protein [Deltaproteobacteria bacterium]